uniref:G patch domain-containing protein 4 isoform X2 n=1 Tax=Pristiophorus japonicus TaxID=55135 RepID=UPI00398F19B6
MDFAERHLKERGWARGKGLGPRENGISEAIKVKVKCGTAGDGVEVKKVEEEAGSVTNKKPRKAQLCKDLLYGRFIKAATLMPTSEGPLVESESSDDSDVDEKLDLSSTTRLTDEELVRACGGRTGHKGARHGLTMSAKLIRLEEQEREFLAKYGQSGRGAHRAEGEAPATGGTGTEGKAERKKKKKKRASPDHDPGRAGNQAGGGGEGPSQATGAAGERRKGAGQPQLAAETEGKQKRKRRGGELRAELGPSEAGPESRNAGKREKRKKRNKGEPSSLG